MASAVAIASDGFLDYCSTSAASVPPSCGWLSPRISFSLDFVEQEEKPRTSSESTMRNSLPLIDFEFLPDDPVSVLPPADELISEGKIVPLDLAPAKPAPEVLDVDVEVGSGVIDLKDKEVAGEDDVVGSLVENGGVVISKASRCTRKWKEILWLKKASSSRSLKYLLHRNPKSCSSNDSCSLPLLRESDSSTDTNISSHSSLSPPPLDKEDPKILADVTSPNPPKLRVSKSRNVDDPLPPLVDHPILRVRKNQPPHAPETTFYPRPVSVDSPRMNASGKIVFQNLGRSSSSPSSLNGRPRPKNRTMERSYSSSVHISPVLNVPVCSLRGSSKTMFGLFSQQKKESVKRSSGNCKNGNSSKNEKS